MGNTASVSEFWVLSFSSSATTGSTAAAWMATMKQHMLTKTTINDFIVTGVEVSLENVKLKMRLLFESMVIKY